MFSLQSLQLRRYRILCLDAVRNVPSPYCPLANTCCPLAYSTRPLSTDIRLSKWPMKKFEKKIKNRITFITYYLTVSYEPIVK